MSANNRGWKHGKKDEDGGGGGGEGTSKRGFGNKGHGNRGKWCTSTRAHTRVMTTRNAMNMMIIRSFLASPQKIGACVAAPPALIPVDSSSQKIDV